MTQIGVQHLGGKRSRSTLPRPKAGRKSLKRAPSTASRNLESAARLFVGVLGDWRQLLDLIPCPKDLSRSKVRVAHLVKAMARRSRKMGLWVRRTSLLGL